MKLLCSKLQYRVNQKGQDPNLDQYLASLLSNSLIALQEFHYVYLNRPGPLRNLAYWLECAQKDKFLKARVDDNLEGLEPEF